MEKINYEVTKRENGDYEVKIYSENSGHSVGRIYKDDSDELKIKSALRMMLLHFKNGVLKQHK